MWQWLNSYICLDGATREGKILDEQKLLSSG